MKILYERLHKEMIDFVEERLKTFESRLLERDYFAPQGQSSIS